MGSHGKGNYGILHAVRGRFTCNVIDLQQLLEVMFFSDSCLHSCVTVYITLIDAPYYIQNDTLNFGF
jgi:hypothetical protein